MSRKLLCRRVRNLWAVFSWAQNARIHSKHLYHIVGGTVYMTRALEASLFSRVCGTIQSTRKYRRHPDADSIKSVKMYSVISKQLRSISSAFPESAMLPPAVVPYITSTRERLLKCVSGLSIQAHDSQLQHVHPADQALCPETLSRASVLPISLRGHRLLCRQCS
jgi:hypothetical protein